MKDQRFAMSDRFGVFGSGSRWRAIFLASLPPVLMLGCAGSGGASAAHGGNAWDGEVRVHGALRAMMHEGQTGPMVGLDALPPADHRYAVGALADLAGEITIIDGLVYLSFPEGADTARTEAVVKSDADAALLVAAIVPAWKSLTTERPIRFEEIDEAIAGLAAQAGMDLDARFPFLLRGRFENLRWHVIDGRRLTGGESSHREHQAAAAQMGIDQGRATLVGFYSRNDQGVFTHMGSNTHIHCMIETTLSAGHVDHVDIPAGTTVEFPVR